MIIVMTTRASGPFDVKMTPQAPEANVGDPVIGRMGIEKQFHGDLEATSRGQMLASRSDVAGSAGYVAIERVTGTLAGRTGSFVLQHYGIMTRGEAELILTVIPDSGTGELTDLSGKMAINIVDKKHSYDFDFSLPDIA